MDEIEVNGVKYVRADLSQQAKDNDGLRYVIVRCKGAGVHAGYLLQSNDSTRFAELVQARRLWRWYGKTLTGLALEGTFAPEKCKFADQIGTKENPHRVGPYVEILPCTEKARVSLEGVSEWKND
jgi:hypothetical protein